MNAGTLSYRTDLSAEEQAIAARAIDQYLGRTALSESIARGPSDFFQKYAQVAPRDPALPRLSPHVLRAAGVGR